MCARHSTGLVLDTGILDTATGLEAIGGKKKRDIFFFRQFTGLCTLSLFLLYYSANNLLHHYKEETADLMRPIDNLIQSVSPLLKHAKHSSEFKPAVPIVTSLDFSREQCGLAN